MPELPEVETFRRMLSGIQNSPLISVESPSPVPPKKFPDDDALKSLLGVTIAVTERKGKLIRLVLSNGSYLYIHQMMTGRISTPSRVVALESLNSSSYPPPHTHLILKTSTAECAWSDSRRFGQVFLTDSEDAWESLAPDALSMSSPEILVAAATTFQQLSSKGKGAKELLLDQKRFVSGIGNWIADEIMYQCEIHPDQNYLTLGEATTLLKAACDICTTAIRCNEEKEGGGDEEMNAFPDDWLFHYRWAKKATGAKDSKGRNISFLTSGGRTSAIVALIQKKQGRKRAAEEAKTDKTKTKAKSAPKSKAKPSTKANAPSKRKR